MPNTKSCSMIGICKWEYQQVWGKQGLQGEYLPEDQLSFYLFFFFDQKILFLPTSLASCWKLKGNGWIDTPLSTFRRINLAAKTTRNVAKMLPSLKNNAAVLYEVLIWTLLFTVVANHHSWVSLKAHMGMKRKMWAAALAHWSARVPTRGRRVRTEAVMGPSMTCFGVPQSLLAPATPVLCRASPLPLKGIRGISVPGGRGEEGHQSISSLSILTLIWSEISRWQKTTTVSGLQGLSVFPCHCKPPWSNIYSKWKEYNGRFCLSLKWALPDLETRNFWFKTLAYLSLS